MHKDTGKYFAMKVMDKARIVKTNQVEHTIYEKRILQSIRFPFIVNMEYSFKDNSYLYLVMPFINGGEMFTHLRKYAIRMPKGLSFARFYSNEKL